MKILQKILGWTLIGILVVPMFLVKPLELKAAGGVEIIVGNHSYGEETNMVIVVTLGADMASGQWLDLYFSNILNEDDLTIDDVNVRAYTDDDNNPVTPNIWVDITTTLFSQATVNDAIQFNSLGRNLYEGDKIYYYLGMPDDVAAGYMTGETYFNTAPPASHLFTNESSGSSFSVTTDSSIAGNDGLVGVAALVPTNNISMEGVIAPYIRLKLHDPETNVVANGEESVLDYTFLTVSTNVDAGYNVYYRATDLAKVDDPAEIITPALNDLYLTAGQGKWGLRFYTATAIGSGVLPTIESAYGTNRFSAVTDGSLSKVFSTDSGPSDRRTTVYTILSSSLEDLPGDYQSVITFNVFATF